ncbi:MAG: hypothetical protein QM757_03860 [Paludibaculum sp.]
MRHIDIRYERASAAWETKAAAARIKIKAAAEALAAASPNEKKARREALSKVINSYRELWKECKEQLRDLSEKKCWYCESHEKRSHMAVDHFRPKAEVKDCEDHPGYWWLAVSFENFRYACTFCNSLLKETEEGPTCGKGTAFPLLNPEDRSYVPASQGKEKPILLDPIVAGDCRQLWFNDEGRAVPKAAAPKAKDEAPSKSYRRADESITLYNLNAVDTVEARYAIHQDVKALVKRANRWYGRLGVDEQAETEYDEALTELVGMVSQSAEFSSTARAALMGHRDLEWIDDVWRVR